MALFCRFLDLKPIHSPMLLSIAAKGFSIKALIRYSQVVSATHIKNTQQQEAGNVSEFSIQILSGIGLFFLGVILGALFQRCASGSEAVKSKRLEQKLAELQDSYTKYQAEVSSHFMETARKVQTLNESYRDVHAQLAKGASRLCSEGEADDFLAISFTEKSSANSAKLEEDDTYHPPMDYAPKDSPEAKGTLAEDFGLKRTTDQQETTPEYPPRA